MKRVRLSLMISTACFALVIAYFISAGDERYRTLLLALFLGAALASVAFLYPRHGFYVLILSSMFNRFEIPLGEVHLRADQLVLTPVLLGVVLRWTLLLSNTRYRFNLRQWNVRVPLTVIAGLILYILLNGISSLAFSPNVTQSLEIVVWLSLSFLALVVTYLVVGRYVTVEDALLSILVAGFVSAAVGIVLFVLFRITGLPVGVQEDPITSYISATGTFFEANIFGSLQAFSAASGLALLCAPSNARLRIAPVRWIALGTFLSVLALTLSYTRAAWVAFLCTLPIIFLLYFLRSGRPITFFSRVLVFGLAALSVLAPAGLLTSLIDRLASVSDVSSGTIAYRLVRVDMALADWATSPVLGLGTNSFGQRHFSSISDQGLVPEHLPNLFITTLYDTGVIGLMVLVAVFGVVLVALVRKAIKDENPQRSVLSIALLAGIVSLLISYQATNAWWYSYNWIILAIAAKHCQKWRTTPTTRKPIVPRAVIKTSPRLRS